MPKKVEKSAIIRQKKSLKGAVCVLTRYCCNTLKDETGFMLQFSHLSALTPQNFQH
jgi:hypothetical protein